MTTPSDTTLRDSPNSGNTEARQEVMRRIPLNLCQYGSHVGRKSQPLPQFPEDRECLGKTGHTTVENLPVKRALVGMSLLVDLWESYVCGRHRYHLYSLF